MRYMFQKEVDELFSSMANAISTNDDILIAGLDECGKEHDEMLEVLCICRLTNHKYNKDKCLFRCMSLSLTSQISGADDHIQGGDRLGIKQNK